MSINREKEASLIHRGLGRVEFFDFTAQQMGDLQGALDSMAAEGRGRFSFHNPIHRPAYFPYSGVTCFFLNEDREKRELSFRLLERSMELAKEWGAQYMVSHLTFGPTDSKDAETAEGLAAKACMRMAELSRVYAVPLDVEFAAYTDSFNRAALFAETVGKHPELGVCIDAGHAFLGALKRGRDYLDDIAALAPAARSLHLWNSLGPEHTKQNHHTPLHPCQDPKDGWIDIEGTLKLVRQENPRLNVIFEYPVKEVTAEIQEGYDWVAGIISQ